MNPPVAPGAARLAGRGALALLAGGLVGCSLPPFGPWYLAPLGLAVAAGTITRRPVGRRALCGLLVGIGQFSVGCVWALEFTGLGYVALVACESLFVTVAFIAVPPRRGRLVAFAGSLTLLEWARDHWPFGGLPLGGTALGQADGPLAGTRPGRRPAPSRRRGRTRRRRPRRARLRGLGPLADRQASA